MEEQTIKAMARICVTLGYLHELNSLGVGDCHLWFFVCFICILSVYSAYNIGMFFSDDFNNSLSPYPLDTHSMSQGKGP